VAGLSNAQQRPGFQSTTIRQTYKTRAIKTGLGGTPRDTAEGKKLSNT